MKKVLIIVTLIGFVVINSCKKPEIDTETQSAVDNAVCEAEFGKIVPQANDAAVKQPGAKKTETAGCVQVVLDTTLNGGNWPRTMYIIFDTAATSSGCVGNDGKVRKGILEVVLNRRWKSINYSNSVALARITPINYWVNGIKYEGTIDVYRPAINVFRTVVTNGRCWNSNWDMNWNCNRTLTTNFHNIVTDSIISFSTYGSSDGVNRNGLAYNTNVDSSTPLVKTVDCKYVGSGILSLTPDGKAARSIDYGNGNCDNKATVTINGNNFEIDM